MNKPTIIAFFTFFALVLSFSDKLSAQTPNIAQKADSLYKARQYAEASNYYLVLAEKSDFPAKRASAYYDRACCLALAGKADDAFIALKKAVAAGYDNKNHVLSDLDLISLRQMPEWTPFINSIHESKRVLNADPAQGKFITTDILHFWKAYDNALKDTAHFKQIMKRDYFDVASKGMNDYMGIKVSSIDFFVQHVRSAPAFYKAIRANSLKVDDYKPSFLASYRQLKSIYPDARFPDIYFVIGAFTAGGTVSNTGLLVGVNQACTDATVPLGELSTQLQTRLLQFNTVPNLVAHELIHYQQDGMKNDTTTLSYAIKEGMADFIGELISGAGANPVLYNWAKGKEQRIWNKFKADMYYNRYGNWIANSKQSTPDNLPDQGYWIGYQICKSYYEQANDKNKAVYDMLHIQNYRDFLEQSRWEIKLAALPVQ